MRALFRSSLRLRVFLTLLPLVAMFLIMGFWSIGLFSKLAGGVDATVTENYRSIMAVQSIHSLLADLALKAPDMAANPAAGANALAEYARQFERDTALLSKRRPLPGEARLVSQLADQFNELSATLLPSNNRGTVRNPAQLRDPDMVFRVASMNRLLEKIRALNYSDILATNQAIQKATSEVSHLMALGLIVVLLVTVYSCYLIGRSVVLPIETLTTATKELSDGELRRPLTVSTADEFGVLAAAFNKMAIQLQEYRRSTTEEIVRLHRTMEATLASFPDPIFVLNKEGLIELKNPAAAALAAAFGIENQLPDRLNTIALSVMRDRRNFLPEGFDEGISLRVCNIDKFYLPRVLAMRNREDALFGVAVVLQDVTRFRLLDSAKTNLVATVSHELKSPLTSVRVALHLLLEKTVGGLTVKQEQLVQAARDDNERLLGILNDLLDLARLEEGDAELRLEKVAPVVLLHTAREEMAGQASAGGVRINCVVDPQLPAVSVDRQRIGHVFSNLMTNAIKYSPPGGEIVLRAARSEEGGVQFSVTDQGPGIPEQFQARVFDRFFRVPGQDKKGAGLGLPIAREIAVAHGGRIGVKSAPGRGSTFYVVLRAAS